MYRYIYIYIHTHMYCLRLPQRAEAAAHRAVEEDEEGKGCQLLRRRRLQEAEWRRLVILPMIDYYH